MYNHQHFQQAKSTPFGQGTLAKLIGASGLTSVCDNLLKGTLFENHDDILFPELRSFLHELAIPPEIQGLPDIMTEISIEEYTAGYKKWRETTSTSPSGRHLGIHKASLKLGSITADLCEMLNIVIRSGIAPTRWCRAVSALLEKDPGSPNINRLCIIHLYGADYNLFLKILWARRLVERGEQAAQFGQAQQGSRQGRTANDVVLLKRLSYDLTRLLRTNLGTFDNDAKSCYDRVVNGIAMLVSRRLGMPAPAIATHAKVLERMKYYLKTAFGISDSYIQTTNSDFLFGTGQGSGASPAVWLLISTVMLSVLAKITKRGMVFQTPDGTVFLERYSDAFVDDTQNGVNDAFLQGSWTLKELSINLQNMSQSWEKLLFCTGGSLELSKCFYYLLYWRWVDGLPVLSTKEEIVAQIPLIHLTSGYDTAPRPISLRDPTEAHKTLGVFLAPSGKDTAQAAYLEHHSNKMAALISSSNLSRIEALLAYKTSWFPSVSYSLPTLCLSAKHLDAIQSQATRSFLEY
jgi:hypothetical protein